VEACFWDIETSGQTNSAGGIGKTTAEMQTASTFLEAGWDFVGETANGTDDIWKISEGLDYPRLWWEKYSGGSGDPNNPYKIATAEDLMLLGETPEDYDKHFMLTADIDLDPNMPGRKVFDRAVIAPDTDPTLNKHGNQEFDGGAFTGVFDGNGHTISHLTIGGGSYLGLFGQLEPGATISNLGLDEVYINGTGDYVGGLVGWNYDGIITLSYCTGTIIGTHGVGGLVGNNYLGSITLSYKTGTVTGGDYVGGLVGFHAGVISTSYNTGTVTGTKYVGGLVGRSSGNITTSYSTGMVSGDSCVGGLVGKNWYNEESGAFPPPLGTLEHCYSTGPVTGNTDVGGLVGINSAHDVAFVVTGCFWDIEASGQEESPGGIGKTTVEMKSADIFLEDGWDFVGENVNGIEDIWRIDEGQDYPRLWWERSTDDLFFLVVDDFESYNEDIFRFWIDGWETPTNGSTVSILSNIDPYFNPDLWGFKVPGVHGGEWSMACFYDNTNTKYSEATKILVWPRNWKQDGVGVLSLWFNGDPANAPEPMYVALANTDSSTAVVYHDNPNATQIDMWAEWRIDLQEFADQGVDLTNVNSITIGLGNRNNPVAGGSGLVFFDDICLYRSTP
ncbi:MAG: GLUG motif-containing protein, partial [Planctomycetota bacterium]